MRIDKSMTEQLDQKHEFYLSLYLIDRPYKDTSYIAKILLKHYQLKQQNNTNCRNK